MTKLYESRDPLEEIRHAYRLFVGDDISGKISLRALRKVAKELNENLDDEELQAMIDEFDLDQDSMSELTSIRRRVYQNYDCE